MPPLGVRSPYPVSINGHQSCQFYSFKAAKINPSLLTLFYATKSGFLTLLKGSAPKRLGRLLPLDFDALSQNSTYNIVFSCVKDHKSERSLYCLFRIVTFKKKTTT